MSKPLAKPKPVLITISANAAVLAAAVPSAANDPNELITPPIALTNWNWACFLASKINWASSADFWSISFCVWASVSFASILTPS